MNAADVEILECIKKGDDTGAVERARDLVTHGDLQSARAHVRRLARDAGVVRKQSDAEIIGAILLCGFLIACALGIYACSSMTAETERLRQQQANDDARASIASAISRHQIVPRMSADEVTAAWGAPRRKEHSDFEGGRSSDTWFYDGGRLVIFTDGKVHAVSGPGR